MNYLCPKPLDSFLVDPNNYYSMHMSKTIYPIWIIILMKTWSRCMLFLPSQTDNWGILPQLSQLPLCPAVTPSAALAAEERCEQFLPNMNQLSHLPLTRLLSAEVWNIIHFLIRGVIKLFLIYCEYPNTLFECLGECMYIMYYSFNTKLLKSFKEIFSDYR